MDEVKYKYHVCYNTTTEENEGGQNMSVSEAKEINERNRLRGDPRRWIVDKDLSASPNASTDISKHQALHRQQMGRVFRPASPEGKTAILREIIEKSNTSLIICHRGDDAEATSAEEKLLSVRISHSPASGNFFIDFWDSPASTGGKYIVSVKLNQAKAEVIGRELGIKIFIQ